jgi:hypothetical protein
VTHVDWSPFAASLAIADDVFGSVHFEDDEFGLWIFAGFAQDEFLYENVEEFTEAVSVVSTVDNVSVVFLIERCLSPKLTAEELGSISGRATESSSYIGHIRDDGFYTISFAFDFCGKKRHAVTIELVIDIAANIDDSGSHTGQKDKFLAKTGITGYVNFVWYTNRSKHESSALTEDARMKIG